MTTTKQTSSTSFSVGDYFEVIEGPWKGERGQITFIGDVVFGYRKCDGSNEGLALPNWYMINGWMKRIRRC